MILMNAHRDVGDFGCEHMSSLRATLDFQKLFEFKDFAFAAQVPL